MTGEMAGGEPAAGQDPRDGAQWWHQPFRTFQTNLREIDAELDVEAVLTAIESYGADTWLLSVGGIIANYPSRLEAQTVNPRLDRRPSGDLVGDATRAAEARGIRVLARMDFSKVDARRAERNPQWCFVAPDGRPQVYNGYRSVCPSGEYYQREMFDVVAEVLERYPICGLFFNWMSFNEVDYSRRYWGVCQCEACRRGFARFAPGVPLPAGPEDEGYGTWKVYTAAVLAELNQRMRAHVRRLAPGAALIQGDRADITFHEANNAVGRELWHQAIADAVDVARSEDPSRTVFVNAVAFMDMPYRWAGEDPRHMEQYAVQSIAHGAQPSTYIMGTPADSPFQALKAGEAITRFHRDHQSEYTDLVATARTALVRPRGGHVRSRREFEGWHSALSENHIPFVVLAEPALATISRDRVDLIVLPDLGDLPEEATVALTGFVAAGGAVIATGSSGWSPNGHQFDAGGEHLAQKAVFDTEESLRSLHLDIGRSVAGGMRPTESTTRSHGPQSGDAAPLHVPVIGEFRAIGVTGVIDGTASSGDDGADGTAGDAAALEVDWPVLGRSLYGPPEKCYGNEPTGHAGRIRRRCPTGGSVTVLPWLPGQVLRELGLSAVAAALAETVATAGPANLRWSATVPSFVRIVPGRGAKGPLIHLINRSGERPQRFVDPVTTGVAELDIPCEAEPRAVRALVAGEDLEWDWSAGTLSVRTPPVDVFEALSVRC
ncbi:alpha-amylase family protein [Brachybacterium sp. GCM10030267]|uniref:alpha-amylase family protein n=1 Tax=unclassified Brachybacterium TaxID=2623841 RepID=UPI0036238CF1